MAEITVNGIGRDATDAQIEDFFSFCGKVKSVVVTPVDADTKTKSAKVLFEKSEAVKTALLLSDSELGGSKVSIVAAPGAVTHTGDGDETPPTEGEDIRQEHKPRSAILAEYLSHGYVLGDKVIARGLELDQKHGVSSRFTNFITQLDNKYKISENAAATDKAYGVTENLHKTHVKVSKYLDDALSTETGSKVRSFYTDAVKNAQDVHSEAQRLATLKHQAAGNQPGVLSTGKFSGETAPTSEK
jgi:RNA recognition motif. (a.k.a. RRM, RBD, or RNP domain)